MRGGGWFSWLAVVLLLIAGFGIGMSLRSYRVFNPLDLVAVVECQPPSQGAPYRFRISYAPMADGVPGPVRNFSMAGDQWMVSGEILKWHPLFNLLGFKTGHKLTRISGRYVRTELELSQPKSAYDLNGGIGRFWQLLHRWGRWIPFVQAVYGSSAYCMAQPNTRWGVYVTLSGYLVRPLRER